MFPREKEPETIAAAKALLVAPPKFAAVHYMKLEIGHGTRILVTYIVEDSQRGDDSIDQIDTSQAPGPVCCRKKRHEGTTEDTSNLLVRCDGRQGTGHTQV